MIVAVPLGPLFVKACFPNCLLNLSFVLLEHVFHVPAWGHQWSRTVDPAFIWYENLSNNKFVKFNIVNEWCTKNTRKQWNKHGNNIFLIQAMANSCVCVCVNPAKKYV